MKLIDLLVEKLEEWPEGAVCIAQDENGCKVCSYDENDLFLATYNKWCTGGEYNVLFECAVCTDWQTALVTREMWEEAKGAKTEWDGTGYPPVGTVCEYRCLDHGDWFECEIRYVLDNEEAGDRWTCVAYCHHLSYEQVLTSNSYFRPLPQKTPKELWVEKMCSHAQEYCTDNIIDWLNRCYDAGLAKDIDNEN